MNYLQNRPTMLTDQVKEYLLPNLFIAAVRAGSEIMKVYNNRD